MSSEYSRTIGYHALTKSWSKSLLGLLGEPHNETVDILSHLFGTLAALTCLGTLVLEFGPHRPLTLLASKAFDWPLTIFYSSAAICLSLSATFHISMSHSQQVCERLNTFDYVGIVVLITGTFWPSVYYGFSCQPLVWLFYCSTVGIFAARTIYLLQSPRYRQSQYRTLRTRMFLCLGFSGIVPFVHNILQYGYNSAMHSFSLPWLSTGAALYVLGALSYVQRFPERFAKPGCFDIFGSSHQLLHICVLLAVWAHGESSIFIICQFYSKSPIQITL